MAEDNRRWCGRLSGLVFVIGLALASVLANAQDNTPPLDVRVLVDVSGSMAENDPDNLRLPASNLLIELLPEGSRAGLWTFGRDVNMLVPYGTVNAEWRQVARRQVSQIGSPGFNSNIGGAMDTASFDFDWSTGFNPKQYVLLSDGIVDVPPDAAAGQAERRRILNQLVPRFQTHNATIHTVRLSDRSDAFFMQQLAAQTGGNNHLARQPEDMLGILLQVLDIAVGGQEEVTLDARQAFQVDSSISEFTATILHGSDASTSALTLIAPDGQRYTQPSPPSRAEWRTGAQYDLITVRQPDAGEWRVEGSLDPNSRITVLSDLNLQVDPIPLNAAVRSPLTVEALINDVSGQVDDVDFLSLLSLDVSIMQAGERLSTSVMGREGSVFSADLMLPRDAGTYQIVVEADGQTFQRRRVSTVNVREPIALEVNPAGAQYELSVVANLPGAMDDLRRFLAEIEGPDGEVRFRPFEQQAAGQWSVRLGADAGPGLYSVSVDAQFVDGVGSRSDWRVAPVQLTFPVSGNAPIPMQVEPPPEPETVPEPIVPPELEAVEPEPAPELVIDSAPVDEPEVVIEPAPEPEPIAVPAPEPESTDDDFLSTPPATQSMLPYILAAAGGLVTVLLLYLGYRLMTRHKPADDSALTDTEKAALADLDNYADDGMAEDLAPATEDPVPPTLDEAMPDDESSVPDDESSVLDDDFDLESLGIGLGDDDIDDDQDLDGEPDDIDLDDPVRSGDPEHESEEKPPETSDYAADEFDLSEDEIDDMLDDSLNDDDKK